LRLDQKMQPIPWTEWPTGALVGAGALWPNILRTKLKLPSTWQLAQLPLILFNHSRYGLYHVFSLVISVPTLFLCPPTKWGEPLQSGILSCASHELLLFNLDIQLNQPDQFHVLKVLKRRKNYVYFICVINLCDMCCI